MSEERNKVNTNNETISGTRPANINQHKTSNMKHETSNIKYDVNNARGVHRSSLRKKSTVILAIMEK